MMVKKSEANKTNVEVESTKKRELCLWALAGPDGELQSQLQTEINRTCVLSGRSTFEQPEASSRIRK